MATIEQQILICDDEERIRRLLNMYLVKDGFVVTEADNGAQALDLALSQDFDMVLLDIMMPEMTGIEVLEKLRQSKDTPVILISAKGEENHRVEGLSLGADDYIVKPFSPREVLLRIHSILKRITKEISVDELTNIVYPNFEVSPTTRQVQVYNKPVNLTPKEFDLLLFLASSPEEIFSRETLLREVWRYDYLGELRTIDTHIKRLREKLNDQSEYAAKSVVTVWGRGYKFSPAMLKDLTNEQE